MGTPDISRGRYFARRAFQSVVILVFVVAVWVVSTIHLLLAIPAFFVGALLVNTDAFQGYGSAMRELAWAREVLADTNDTGSSSSVGTGPSDRDVM